MREPEYSIPSAFIRLDTNINAADSFANVRDLITLRKNHNKLLATRTKRQVFTFTGAVAGHETAANTFSYPYGSSPYFGDVCMSVPIKLTDLTQECQFSVSAKETTNGTVILYPVIHKFGTAPQINTNQKITVSGAAYAIYQDLVSVPNMTPKERDLCMFTCLVHGGYSAISGKGASNVLAVGPNWVDSVFVFAAEDITLFPTNYRIEPNSCTAVYNIGDPYGVGTTYRAYHQYDWSSTPTTSDTVDQYTAKYLGIESATLYEFPISSSFTAQTINDGII